MGGTSELLPKGRAPPSSSRLVSLGKPGKYYQIWRLLFGYQKYNLCVCVCVCEICQILNYENEVFKLYVTHFLVYDFCYQGN